MDTTTRTAWQLGVAVVLSITSVAAYGQDKEEGPTLYGGASVAYDSNFFRIEEEFQKPQEATAPGFDDMIYRIFAGLDAEWRLGSKNRIQVVGEIVGNAHDKFTTADNTSGDLLLRWAYSGNATDFAVAYTQVAERVDFVNQNIPRVDFRTRNEVSVGLTQRFTPRWSVFLRGSFADIEFEQALPVQRAKAVTGIRYRSRSDNSIALVAEFQERQSDFDNLLGFEEYLIGPELDWKLTENFRLDAKLKYQERTPKSPVFTVFDGPTGEIRFEWAPSPNVVFEGAVFRRISTLGDQLANFAIVDGQEFRGIWGAGEKLQFVVEISHELRDFQLEPSLADFGAVPREDDLVLGGAGFEWQPRRQLQIDFMASIGNRESNREFQDFRYENFAVGFRWYFL